MFSWLKNRIWRISYRFRWTGYLKMELKITRLDITDQGIFGRLDTDGFSCVTLENDALCIPAGRYKITLYKSPVHGSVPLLHDVPGRSWIEIHAGNYERDSKGCILVAKQRNGFAIEYSKPILKQLVELIQKADDVWVTIV